MIKKLENKKRVDELSPKNTLKEIGLKKSHHFADIGAGTGIFTFAANEITDGNIYSVDTSDDARSILTKRKQELNAKNINIIDDISKIEDKVCDFALICTVLHEVDDINKMLKQIKRILKSDGTLAIIEFHKNKTPIGPPENHRLSKAEIQAFLKENDFKYEKTKNLGENFYLITAKN